MRSRPSRVGVRRCSAGPCDWGPPSCLVLRRTKLGRDQPHLVSPLPLDPLRAALGRLAQALGVGQSLQLLQRAILDLADTLTCDVERLSYFLECAGALPGESVAQFDDLPLAR